MQLTVVTKSLGTKLNEMLIYAGSTQIGEYERSQDADIERKKLEIENVADLLVCSTRPEPENSNDRNGKPGIPHLD